MKHINLNYSTEYICQQHGSRSILPCAWPKCKNGINEPEFEVTSTYGDKKQLIYKRREWQSPLGDVYYSWESSNLPNWLYAPQIFWNEIRRHKLISDSFPKTVYHYTSIEGFIGIVNSRTLWMTEFGYLNDRR